MKAKPLRRRYATVEQARGWFERNDPNGYPRMLRKCFRSPCGLPVVTVVRESDGIADMDFALCAEHEAAERGAR